MKICIVTTGSTMMELFVTGPAEYMHNNGINVTLICDLDAEFMQRNSFAKCIRIKIKRGLDFLGMISAVVKLYQIFQSEKFDIIQYSSPNAALCSALAGWLANIKVRLYCQWGIRYVSFSGIKRIVFKLLEKMTCDFSTVIEPDSFGNLEFGIAEDLYKKEKARVIWYGSACGVDLQRFSSAKKNQWRTDLRSKLKLSSEDFVFGFVGRITKDKGVEELISAFQIVVQECSNAKLLFVGEENELDTLDKSLINWMKSNDCVCFAGRVNNVQEYFACMDTFILPSYREGFGTVVLEAAAMEIPIIATNIPGPTDFVIDGVTGLLVSKKNTNELCQAMLKIKNNSNLAKELSDNAKKIICEKFDQKIMYEKIYEDRIAMVNNID